MKVTLYENEVLEYRLSLEIEREGEKYLADITYNEYDNYTVTFRDQQGNKIDYPQWAKDYEENNPTGDNLGYWLEDQIGGWFTWQAAKEKVSA